MGNSNHLPLLVVEVEDSEIQAELLRRILVRAGYRVAVARNGAEGLALTRREKPALIVSDINMPKMNGFEMCREIRRDEALRDIPVIMLTTLDDVRDVIRGLNAGADSYVTKPYSERYLLSRIEAALAEPHRPDDERIELDVAVDGEAHHVVAGRHQILNLLVSTYGNAVLQNRELIEAQDELKRLAESEAKVHAERIAQLERELHGMAQIGRLPASGAAGRQADKLPPVAFRDMVEHYQELLDLAVERQAYRVEHDIPGQLLAMAGMLCSLNAGPRDVVEIHGQALKIKIGGLKPELKFAYIEEGRLMVLELMGYLANGYHAHSEPGTIE